MSDHAYSVGQSVSLSPSSLTRVSAATVYKIVAVLPPLGTDFQYRIRNATERHERVVPQSQIVRALPPTDADHLFMEGQSAAPGRG